MTLIILNICCLVITIATLQAYVYLDAYSRVHRLLPVVLACFCLYHFYELTLCIAGATLLIQLLERLLLVQVEYLVLHYIKDIAHLRFHILVEVLLFFSLVVADGCIYLDYIGKPGAHLGYMVIAHAYFVAVFLLILLKRVKARKQSSYERTVSGWLLAAVLVPTFMIPVRVVFSRIGQPALSLGMLTFTLIVLVLLKKGGMIELQQEMQEKMFVESDVATVFMDDRLNFIAANKVANKMFRRTVPSRFQKNPSFYESAEMIRGALRNQENLTFELEGRYYQMVVTVMNLVDNKESYVLTFNDITEERKNTRIMEQLKDDAEENAREKGKFLAIMSHNLRTPIHTIMGIADILMGKKELTAGSKALVTQIKNSGNNMLDQVDDILLHSKLEAGGTIDINIEKYNLEEVLYSLCYMSIINLQSKKVDVSLIFENPCPRYVLGDGRKVRGMVQNLLSNSVKFIEEGEIRCTVRCRDTEEGDYYKLFEVEIMDTAGGMPPEHVTEIFKEYHSFASEKTKDGTGLGLSIVRELSRLMGGDCTAQTDGVRTSTFLLSLIQQIEDTEDCIQPGVISMQEIVTHCETMGEVVEPDYVYPDARILVAEDMVLNQHIFRELVSPWQFSVDFVKNGKEAIEAVENHRYQLIFLDKMMPVMNGVEAAARINEIRKVPIIVQTADLSDDMSKNYAQYGFSDFLEKPTDMKELKRVIEQHILPQYRRLPSQKEERPSGRSSAGEQAAYVFSKELEQIATTLPELAEQDMELFRTKVHGIKSAAKQLGYEELGRKAEILEMAAKTQNVRFLNENMGDFMDTCGQYFEGR